MRTPNRHAGGARRGSGGERRTTTADRREQGRDRVSARPGVIDEAMIRVFSEGYCGLLGIELARRTGWALVVLAWEPCPGDEEDFAWFHVMCRTSDGTLVDVRGRRSLEEVREEWPDTECVRPITPSYIEECLVGIEYLTSARAARRLAASIAPLLIAGDFAEGQESLSATG